MQQPFAYLYMWEKKKHSQSDQKYLSMHANALYLIVFISLTFFIFHFSERKLMINVLTAFICYV